MLLLYGVWNWFIGLMLTVAVSFIALTTRFEPIAYRIVPKGITVIVLFRRYTFSFSQIRHITLTDDLRFTYFPPTTTC